MQHCVSTAAAAAAAAARRLPALREEPTESK